MVELAYQFVSMLQERMSDAWVFAVCFNTAYIVTVWTLTLFFGIVDHFGLLASHKIQQGKFPEQALYKEAFYAQIARTLTNFGVLWVVYTFCLEGKVRMDGLMDSWTVFLAKSIAIFLWLDFSFYWQHRISHHRFFYSKFHKQHHMFKQSVAVAFEFAGTVEALFVNGLPLFVAFFFANLHVIQLSLFLAIRITETIDAHCGYDIPLVFWRYVSGARAHDLHHSQNRGNFGMFHFWDYVCGTRSQDYDKAAKAKIQ